VKGKIKSSSRTYNVYVYRYKVLNSLSCFYIQNCKHVLLRNGLIYKYVCIEIPASKNPY